ncbi:hypothetical protein ACWCQ1_35190 [Streptomyces sp. NPDC002144]
MELTVHGFQQRLHNLCADMDAVVAAEAGLGVGISRDLNDLQKRDLRELKDELRALDNEASTCERCIWLCPHAPGRDADRQPFTTAAGTGDGSPGLVGGAVTPGGTPPADGG